MQSHSSHLAYCTNIHPAESWDETFAMLNKHVLPVRDRLSQEKPYAIGLRLSALAARELLSDSNLSSFKNWLGQENCYVFTINGFPYGSFHNTRVKEQVYRPDWTSNERLEYTQNLITIIAALTPAKGEGSISTLPGSFKEFDAAEEEIFKRLLDCAHALEAASLKTGTDLHLGLEPEPLGHFENLTETLAFFKRFHAWAQLPQLIQKRIGVNYDTCHFALEYEKATQALDALHQAEIRISKIHLSNALRFDPRDPGVLDTIASFDEPTYLHQVLLKDSAQQIQRYRDLPEFFEAVRNQSLDLSSYTEGRIHFHIPLYDTPPAPLSSTQNHTLETLQWVSQHPGLCQHFEIETYTWGVFPETMQVDLTDQIEQEYCWVMSHWPTFTIS